MPCLGRKTNPEVENWIGIPSDEKEKGLNPES
jgi:hypothetical protein